MILESEPDLAVVGEGTDGTDVPSAVARWRPDIVLMDVRMPRIDGLEATRRLFRAAGPQPRVVVLTTFENDEYVYEALRTGASGFLLKRATSDEIVHTLRTVAAGETLVYPQAIRSLAERYGPRRDDAVTRSRLTAREREVLRRVAAGMSNAEIAAELVVGVETVKSHVSSILTKLRARDRTQAVVIAYEAGFVLPGGADPAP
jgi:DNA-binding NarL/FixJ family response regulator